MKRTEIKRKAPMKRGSVKPSVGPTRKRKAVAKVNAKRRKSEFARCYGSKARVEFVKTLRCAASGLYGYGTTENAHVCDDGSKGAGRKSGYRCIAPLLASLHRLLHRKPVEFRRLYPMFDAKQAAADTEAAWQAHTLGGTTE